MPEEGARADEGCEPGGGVAAAGLGFRVRRAGGELLEEGERRLEEGRRREEQRTGTQLR